MFCKSKIAFNNMFYPIEHFRAFYSIFDNF